MPTRKGNKAIVIYFSPEEWKYVCRKAKAANLKNGTYIRVSATKTEIKIYDLKEILAIKRALESVGNNVNQVARTVNRTGAVYQKDIEELQEEFKYFKNAIKNYLFEISPTLIV